MRKKEINVKRYILAAIAACCVLVNMPHKVIADVPGMIVGGDPTAGVAFDTDGLTHTITTSADQTIIDYTMFNIDSGWTVDFVQPSSSANTLNRINGPQSQIFGTLTSNGGVYIVNPAGVIFHNGSSVNVPRLVASLSLIHI